MTTTTKLCTFPGCGRAHSGRGLCGSHLKQDRAGQELRALRPFTPPPCIIDDCTDLAYARGVCRPHYYAGRRGTAPVRIQRLCDIPGCGRVHRAKGLCNHHDQKRRRELKGPTPRKPKAPKVQKPKPAAPKPKKSRLPDGWEKVTPPRKVPSVPRPHEYPELHLTVIEPEVIAAAREVLASWDALDLADMLGIEAAA